MRLKSRYLACLVVLLWLEAAPQFSPVLAQKKLSASEAKDHIGETTTVCGQVASTRFASSAKGQPTFLNLDKPYPNPIFAVLIWGEKRAKFGRPEDDYRNKRICVTGKITEYRDSPEIVVDDVRQIRVESEK